MDSSLFKMGKPDHIQNGQENVQLRHLARPGLRTEGGPGLMYAASY